jgi:hypothetical protein
MLAAIIISYGVDQRGEVIAHFGLAVVSIQRNGAKRNILCCIVSAPDGTAHACLLSEVNRHRLPDKIRQVNDLGVTFLARELKRRPLCLR